MIRIPITDIDIQVAKLKTQQFDSIKTWNKINCDVNYIGYLGEFILDKFLNENRISHIWHQFEKNNWDEPDFTINNTTIDLKTTMDSKLWIQEPKFDIFILARLNNDMKELFVLGWIPKKKAISMIKDGRATEIIRGTRTDYTIPIDKLIQIDKELFSEWC